LLFLVDRIELKPLAVEETDVLDSSSSDTDVIENDDVSKVVDDIANSEVNNVETDMSNEETEI